MDFSNKRVLVTGASRGIGLAVARQFAQRGGRVAINYSQDDAAAQAALASLAGDGHLVIKADIGDPNDVRKMVDKAVRHLGQLDILVNNAGIYDDHPIADVTYDEWQAAWQRVLSINLLGAANASYIAAQYMMRQGGGRIVNVSSRGAFRGEPTGPAYGASKAAMNSMGQSLAKALAPHQIFVGTVAPGFVETEMGRPFLNGPQGDFIRNESPLKRVATPDDVAYAVLFLASEGAEFTTGTIIDVNGASYLRS